MLWDGGYSLNVDAESYIKLDSSGRYFAFFDIGKFDVETVVDISSGRYTKEGDWIIFADQQYGYQMTAYRIDRDNIVFTESFSLFKGKTIDCALPSTFEKWWDEYYDSKWKEPSAKEQIDLYDRSHTIYSPLNFGRYTLPYDKDTCCLWGEDRRELKAFLTIMPDGDYTYSVYDITLSAGQWKRNGNVLELFDEDFNYTFYALIDNNSIIVSMLPLGKDMRRLVLEPYQKYEIVNHGVRLL